MGRIWQGGLLVASLLSGCAPVEESPRVEPPAPLPAVAPAAPPEADETTIEMWEQETGRLFDEIDRNRDGYLDEAELRAGWRILDLDGDGVIERAEAPDLFPYADANSDGAVSPGEMQTMVIGGLEGDIEEDGRISREEWAALRRRLFLANDRNEDLKLDRIEAESARLVLFRF